MLQHFFEGVEARVAQGVREEEVSYQLAFNKQELRKVIKEYPGKEVKKGLDNLYKKVDKHLCEEESLLQVRDSKLENEYGQLCHNPPLLSELFHSFFHPTRWCGTPCKTSSSVSTSTLRIWLADATQDLESPWSLPSRTCWSISPVLPSPTSLTVVHFIPVVIHYCLTMTDETSNSESIIFNVWTVIISSVCFNERDWTLVQIRLHCVCVPRPLRSITLCCILYCFCYILLNLYAICI